MAKSLPKMLTGIKVPQRATQNTEPKTKEEVVKPTAELLATGKFERALMAHRRVPVIVTLADTGRLSERQFKGLARYRDVAIADDRSLIKDSVGKMMEGTGGEGLGLPPSAIRTAIELGYLERELGSLRAIARAIAVDDITLSAWAMQQGGSVMRERMERKKVITWFEPRKRAAKIALVDIRMAGERLAAAINA